MLGAIGPRYIPHFRVYLPIIAMIISYSVRYVERLLFGRLYVPSRDTPGTTPQNALDCIDQTNSWRNAQYATVTPHNAAHMPAKCSAPARSTTSSDNSSANYE